MLKNKKKVWITWETQRRSIELSKEFYCELYILEYNGIFRYLKCIIHTLAILFSNKYDIIFVQNPSMILAALVCYSNIILSKLIIVDRHSTFKFKKANYNLNWIVYKLINNYTIKNAYITIITNDYLLNLVNKIGGNAFVLPDKLPNLHKTKNLLLEGNTNLLFICSFHEDEPVDEVIEAIIRINNRDICLYISGNHDKYKNISKKNIPSNVIFTGFLKDTDYIDMLFAVDAVIVLTTADHTMLCGCYEAIAARKPLITSNKKVLKEYFKGCTFVENTGESISSGIMEVINNYSKCHKISDDLYDSINNNWIKIRNSLEEKINEKDQNTIHSF